MPFSRLRECEAIQTGFYAATERGRSRRVCGLLWSSGRGVWGGEGLQWAWVIILELETNNNLTCNCERKNNLIDQLCVEWVRLQIRANCSCFDYIVYLFWTNEIVESLRQQTLGSCLSRRPPPARSRSKALTSNWSQLLNEPVHI